MSVASAGKSGDRTEGAGAGQRGATVAELIVVLGLSAIIAMAAVGSSIAWLNREAAHSALHEIQAHLQLARMEAVSRAENCTFAIDAATRRIRVVDSAGAVLHRETLDRKAVFEDPDGGPAITLASVSGTTYEATFSPAGVVASGAGTIYVAGGGDHRRITLLVGGATQIEHQVGTAWVGGP